MKNKEGLLGSISRLFTDYTPVLRSGVFMHSAYCRRYLVHGRFKPSILAFLALPHYLVRGETRGYSPNPFFDPTYFASKAPGKRLADYLRDPALWMIPLSDYFDPEWQMQGESARAVSSRSPLQRFWESGFARGVNPTARFNTDFFRHAIARDARNKKEYAYHYLADADPAAPLNADELATLQKRFYRSIDIQTLKYSESPSSNVLVFVQAGDDFPASVFRDAPFDVLINFYGRSKPVDAQYVFHQPGTKITAIRKILECFPELLLKYDAVLFLDDDVELSPAQIARLFEVRAENKLDLLQASLSHASSCFYPILKQPLAGLGLRHLTGVEIMMPILSRRALQTCGWVFNEGVSGWGIDILLSAEVRKKFGNSIGILGDIVAVHARPTDTDNNEFYRFLSRHQINPTVEAGHVTLKFGLPEWPNFIHFVEDKT